MVCVCVCGCGCECVIMFVFVCGCMHVKGSACNFHLQKCGTHVVCCIIS